MTIIASSSDSPSSDNPLSAALAAVTLEDTAPEPSALGGIDPPVPSTLGKSPLFRGGVSDVSRGDDYMFDADKIRLDTGAVE